VVEHFDVVVVGAGLSGIGAAYHLQTECPNKSYVILEARAAIGGTWDLFRYPGIRSDSDMYTLGYRFKPWRNAKAIADGPSILEYVCETARENGIDQKIRFDHKVKRAAWSSDQGLWTVEAECQASREIRRFTCRFLYSCAGYYAYDAGHAPEFEGAAEFAGRVVHPQRWSDDIDYAGKQVVVIGSGATAMTLVPELAKKAAHVVMLQRSPTFVVSAPAVDKLANTLRRLLPAKLAYFLTRWRNILMSMIFFQLVRRLPEFAKRQFIGRVREALGPSYDIERHFTPRYNVWDQRLCLIPDEDLFLALRAGTASVVTDHIERFTRDGIRLRSGQELRADLVVTATGLEMLFLGGMQLTVDGRAVDPHTTLNYKGCMFTDVPNVAYTFGYTNASWTLKADLTAEYVCRLLRHMDAIAATRCTPRCKDKTVQGQPWLDFTSGYVVRALQRFPQQGSKRPFRVYQNYVLDLLMLRYGIVDDGTLEFSAAESARVAAPKQFTSGVT
jgi:cation diffusion facilitator CzcD-associated flavoprotein CzcO